MAKASWCTVTPMSGSKNGSIAISGASHTGRSARTTTVTVTNANGTQPTAAIAVSQAGAAVASTIDESKPDIPKTGGTLTINGTSNSQKLRILVGFIFAPSGNILPLAEGISGTISINGGAAIALVKETDTGGMAPLNSTNHGLFQIYVPTGDPGASAKYTYALTLTFGASIFSTDMLYIIRVVDSRNPNYEATPSVIYGPTLTNNIINMPTPVGAVDCTTKLLAGASTVSASPSSLSLVSAGTAQNVAITSNDDWAVS